MTCTDVEGVPDPPQGICGIEKNEQIKDDPSLAGIYGVQKWIA